jgi:hypothetical protein
MVRKLIKTNDGYAEAGLGTYELGTWELGDSFTDVDGNETAKLNDTLTTILVDDDLHAELLAQNPTTITINGRTVELTEDW